MAIDNMGVGNMGNITLMNNNIKRVLKISAIIIFALLCLPYSRFSRKYINNAESGEQSAIMDKIKYLFLRYGGIFWGIYVIIMAILSYYEPGVAVMGVLFFFMAFSWDSVSSYIDPCEVDKTLPMCQPGYWGGRDDIIDLNAVGE